MDRRDRQQARISFIELDRYYTISQSARILGVKRSYLYYCFDNNPDFPAPVLHNGRRKLLGKDLLRIIEIRNFYGL